MNISWLKLDVNILNDSKIKIIRKYPDGDALFVLWVGLLCLAMKSDIAGYIYITQGLPYTSQDLSREFDIQEKTVEMGLALFKKLNMIDFTQGGIIEVVKFNKHQNIDRIERQRELTRKRVEKHRKKNLIDINTSNDGVTRYSVTRNDTDKNRIDKIRIEKNKIDNIDQFFCDWWELYNKKVGKKEAKKEFIKLNPDNELFNIIMNHTKKYCEARDKEYRKDPERYIKKQSWNDEIITKKQKQNPDDFEKAFEIMQRKGVSKNV